MNGPCRRVGNCPTPDAVTVPAAALVILLVLAAPACGVVSSAPEAATPETAAAPMPNPDRDALVALYHATDGPNWKRNSNWLSDAPLGLWNLVHTDRNGRVTVLALAQNQLRGEIPPELRDLTQLLVLLLYGNQLHGEIPPELGNLANLAVLDLRDNQLTGEIPRELGGLSSLQDVMLGGSNQLTGCIPESLGRVTTNDFDELGLPFCGTTEGLEAAEPLAVSRTGLPTVGNSLQFD